MERNWMWWRIIYRQLETMPAARALHNASQSNSENSDEQVLSPLPCLLILPITIGVNDLYRSENLMDDLAETRASQTVKTRGTSIETSVVFRAKKLYHRGKKLGSGSYAVVRSGPLLLTLSPLTLPSPPPSPPQVYECERQDGMRFAVKVFSLTAHPQSSVSEDEDMHYARKCYHRELDFLRTLSHPHIIAYEDHTVREGVPYVIVEKMNCTLLEVQMDRTTQAPFGQFSPIELNARIISSQLLDGLTYLHNQYIVSVPPLLPPFSCS